MTEETTTEQALIEWYNAKYGVIRDDEKDYVTASQRHTIDIIMARQQHVISHANITITDLKKQKPCNWQEMVEILETVVKLANHSYTYEQIANQEYSNQ